MNTGSILGDVIGTTSARVPSAKVTIKDMDRNVTQERAADASGSFVFPSVGVGRYIITVSAQGFATFVRQDVTVDVGQKVRVDAGTDFRSPTASVTI